MSSSVQNSQFFEERAIEINKAMRKQEKFIIMGDFYIDINTSGSDKSRLKSFCDVFNIPNLISSKTCFLKSRKSIILTITLLSFQKTHKT